MDNLAEFKDYLKLNNRSKNTVEMYEIAINRALRSVSPFNQDNINQFILALRETRKANTINLYINALRAYCRFLGIDIKLPHLFKVVEALPNYITKEELEKEILINLHDSFPIYRLLRIKAILYFMFYSGLRKSEIVFLHRKDFDFETRQIKVFIQKTQSERFIPLNDRMIRLLQEYFDSEPEKINAFNLKSAESLDYIFSKLESKKTQNLFPHMMRHSFAMNLQRNGFTTRQIQFMLGHKNIQSTLRYEIANIETVKEKFQNIT